MAIGMAVNRCACAMDQAGELGSTHESFAVRRANRIVDGSRFDLLCVVAAKLPVGMATAISTSYIVVVVVLSRLFLNEGIGWMKLLESL